MENEQWQQAEGLPGYEVSDLGRLRRGGRILAGGVNQNGRRQHVLRRDGRNVCVNTHRLVVKAFIGPLAARMEVNHINGDPLDNRVANLEIVSRRENFLHARDILKNMGGFHPGTGSKHHQAKLTEDDVRKIRSMFGAGMKPAEIAPLFPVARSVVSRICHRKIWTHVP